MKAASSAQTLRKLSSSAASSVNTFTSTTGPASTAIWRSIGQRTFDEAMELQAPWINNLSEGLSIKDIATVDRVVKTLRTMLEDQDEVDERA